MPKIPFDQLPEHGRLWVFPASRPLSEVEATACLNAVDGFLATWTAHGALLHSGRELKHGQFLLVGVDVDAEAPSGCSIDALVNTLRAFGSEHGLSLIDHAGVWFRGNEGVRRVSRAGFKRLAEEGQVNPDVTVFDNTLTTVGQLRRGALEVPARKAWHGRAFFRERVGT